MITETDDDLPEQCPSCKNSEFHGSLKIGATLTVDRNGYELERNTDDAIDRWSSLWCTGCGKYIVNGGKLQVEETEGSPVDDGNNANLTEFGES